MEIFVIEREDGLLRELEVMEDNLKVSVVTEAYTAT